MRTVKDAYDGLMLSEISKHPGLKLKPASESLKVSERTEDEPLTMYTADTSAGSLSTVQATRSSNGNECVTLQVEM